MPTVAYRAIRRRRAFVNAPVVRRVLDDALDNTVKPYLIEQFEHRVANWDHKPIFKARKRVTVDATAVTVFPSGPNKQIYKWVSGGTRPHPIPKTPKTGSNFLVFQSGGPGSYKAKTGAGGKFGGPGIVVGGKAVRARQVQHPGFEGSHFEKYIRKDAKPWFSRTMENAWRRGIRRMSSG